MRFSLPLASLIVLFSTAGCPGTSSLSGVYIGDAELAECTATGTKVESTANDEQFRVRDDGSDLLLTWRGCGVVAVEQTTSARTWTIAQQSCTIDNVARTVSGALYKSNDASSSITISLDYWPASQTTPTCVSTVDAVVSR
jgi:hypothetical protein